MSSPEVEAASLIEFTDEAAAKVRQLIAGEGDNERMLRLHVQGGGCSGFEHRFGFEKGACEDDFVVENSDVKLLLDPLSMQYLMGASIDYKEDLQGARFIVTNPTAASTCGCGSSFSI